MTDKFSKKPYSFSEFFQSSIAKYPRTTLAQRQFAVKDVIRKMKAKGIKRDYTLPKGWK